jgi:hypothetical protein
MKTRTLLITSFIYISGIIFSQEKKDTIIRKINPLTVEGYIDAYFCFDANEPKNSVRPYFVSYSRHNEFNINLAYVAIKYNKENFRATFTPGFGTYVNANYAAERMTLKNIIEANIGFKVFKNKNIWIDAGVIPSPYTNENAISFDQINYSRSIAPEYVPYYLSGAKLTIPLGKKVNLYGYVLNGWQEIEDVNSPLAIGTSLEIKPTDKTTITWNTYSGNEQSEGLPDYKMRYFTDVYIVFNSNKHWLLSACAYIGMQEKLGADDIIKNREWYQANVAAKYYLNEKHSISGRIEYFNDVNMVMITPVTGVTGFDAFSGTLGYNLSVSKQVMFRIEGRYFSSSYKIYEKKGINVNDNTVFTAGLTARFN